MCRHIPSLLVAAGQFLDFLMQQTASNVMMETKKMGMVVPRLASTRFAVMVLLLEMRNAMMETQTTMMAVMDAGRNFAVMALKMEKSNATLGMEFQKENFAQKTALLWLAGMELLVI